MSRKFTLGPLLFAALNAFALFWLLSDSKRVLVLHSYTPTYAWTDSINRFLTPGLEKRSYINHQFYYMDSKKYYNSKTEKSSLHTITEYDPTLIIAFDDNAQKLLSKHYHLLAEDISIIFAGMNGYVKKYQYADKPNITGIFERKPIFGILYSLDSFNQFANTPNHKAVHLLTDKSSSSLIDVELLQQEGWQNYDFSSHSVKSFAQWKKHIKQLNPNRTHYLLVAGYRKLLVGKKSNGKPIYAHHKEVVSWTLANSPVKIIALNTFATLDGFPYAVGASPSEQARESLKMMDEILLNNTKPSTIDYKKPIYYDISINEQAAEEFNYTIPPFLKSFAAASNNIIFKN